MFYEVLASPAYTARGAPPGEETPGKVGVDSGDKLIDHGLVREDPDEPGHTDEVSDEPLEETH